MSLIRLQKTNDVDTVVQQMERNKNDVVKKRSYYFNGNLAYELDFEKGGDLLYSLYKTNQVSLTNETIIFKFQKN
ncbi:MAG: hypothetical protein M3512_07195 [Bacteroidota bacterium]|nr:hypothetical protein [Bacteroidota bacterium]